MKSVEVITAEGEGVGGLLASCCSAGSSYPVDASRVFPVNKVANVAMRVDKKASVRAALIHL